MIGPFVNQKPARQQPTAQDHLVPRRHCRGPLSGRLLGLCLAFFCLTQSVGVAVADDSRLILLLGQGPDGHPLATHEYFAGLRILKKCLDRVDGVHAEIVSADEPFQQGPELLDKAHGAVLFLSEGAKWLQHDAARLEAFQRLAARGGALSGLHWGIGCRDAQPIDKYVALFGACHGGPDRKFAVVTTRTELATPDHPILTGVSSVSLEDEFYYRLKLSKSNSAITPLLRVGIEGEAHMVSWAWDRPDGGRSFGFTGLHFHRNWSEPSYRRLVAQGVLWTLKLPIPTEGLNVDISTNDLTLPERK
ncbi:MAG: ThuA domain-containing protein [Planctomycetes bacterium]|nr:ThuA domain-containing protein [Planctomycetota bacterium]